MSVTIQLDQNMELASAALVRGDYLGCESHCLQALALARKNDNWPYYARILLPLQEARRHRRMIAAEGCVRLGTTDLTAPLSQWLSALSAGCVVVTQPHDAQDALSLVQAARQCPGFVEVLWADNPVEAPLWTISSFTGPRVRVDRPAPPPEWLNHWLKTRGPAGANAPPAGLRPGDWFLDACEALGDAALAQIAPQTPLYERIRLLEQCLEVVPDHEIIHQRLGEAVRALTVI